MQELSNLVAQQMREMHVPGVAVGVVVNHEEQVATFGVTSVENPLPVDEHTLFQIGSITKTVTATVAMRLVEQGELDLDTPVRRYLPEFRMADASVAERVTLRHLFTHMGGWLGDYFEDTGLGEDATAKYVANMAQLPQLTPLGSVLSYNNAGFSLAGRVLEKVTGKPYEDIVREMLFQPLGMSESFFFAHDCITRRTAMGHNEIHDVAHVARPWALARSAHAAGGISSSVRDQLRYARFHLGDGTANGVQVLSRETLQQMQAPQCKRDVGLMGIAWQLRDVDGTRTVLHGGGTNGQLSLLMLVPARGFGLSVLTNGSRGAELHRDVARWALETYLGVREPEPPQRPLNAQQLAAYAGRYSARLADSELCVQDGYLTMQVTPNGGFPDKNSPPSAPPPPPVRLAFVYYDQVLALDAPMKDMRGDFIRADDGSIAWFRFGGRIRKRE